MSIWEIIGIILFLAFCFVLILFALRCLIIFYALDHGWDKEWIDKEDRENGNNR